MLCEFRLPLVGRTKRQRGDDRETRVLIAKVSLDHQISSVPVTRGLFLFRANRDPARVTGIGCEGTCKLFSPPLGSEVIVVIAPSLPPPCDQNVHRCSVVSVDRQACRHSVLDRLGLLTPRGQKPKYCPGPLPLISATRSGSRSAQNRNIAPPLWGFHKMFEMRRPDARVSLESKKKRPAPRPRSPWTSERMCLLGLKKKISSFRDNTNMRSVAPTHPLGRHRVFHYRRILHGGCGRGQPV